LVLRCNESLNANPDGLRLGAQFSDRGWDSVLLRSLLESLEDHLRLRPVLLRGRRPRSTSPLLRSLDDAVLDETTDLRIDPNEFRLEPMLLLDKPLDAAVLGKDRVVECGDEIPEEFRLIHLKDHCTRRESVEFLARKPRGQ